MSEIDPRFTYVGDPSDDFSGPTTLEVFGYKFTKGEQVEVEDKAVARKLLNHSHFANGDDTPSGTTREHDDLVGLTLEQLKAIADAEGVEYDSKSRKGDILEAIRAAREEGDEN